MSAREERLYFRLQRAAHVAKKAADRAVRAEAGITTAQAAVLELVASNPSLSQRRLASLLAQNESAMTTMVTRLAEAGLVARRGDARDGRAYTLDVTARGRKVRSKAARAFRAVNRALDGALDPRGVERLATDLDRIVERLGDRDGEAR